MLTSLLTRYNLLVPPAVTATIDAVTSTTVILTHPAVSGAASYRYYENGGAISPTMVGTTTLQGNRTGRTAGQTYQYQVAAVDALGHESPKSSIASVTIATGSTSATFTPQLIVDFDTGALTNVAATSTVGAYLLSGPNSIGAYDNFDTASGDVPCTLETKKARYTPPGGVGRSLRTQLTFHKGPATFPQTSSRTYPPAVEYYFKGGAAEGTDEQAHRNEVSVKNITPSGVDAPLVAGVEYWLGFSIYLIGANDPHGDPQFQPFSFFGGYCIGPQLHGPTGGLNPCLPLYHGAGSYPSNQAQVATAPIVGYQRGRDDFNLAAFGQSNNGASADTLRVFWRANPITADGVPVRWRIYAAPRSTGPWSVLSENVLSAYVVSGQYTFTLSGLGQQDAAPTTVYLRVHGVTANDVELPGSLVCPGPRKHWSCPMWGHNSSGVSEGTSWNAGPVDADLGHWTDWVFRYRLSTSNTGFFQAWKNGVQVAYFTGINLGEIDRDSQGNIIPGALKPGHYWKIGIYHGHPTDNTSPVPADWPKRHVVYYDEFRHGYVTRAAGPITAVGTSDPGYVGVAPRGVRT